jgi:hypothetical protein
VNTHRLPRWMVGVVGMTVVLLLLSGCAAPVTPAPPTDTPTPLPPTPTLTPLPPTDTPTPEPTATPTRGLVRVTSPEEIIGTWVWGPSYYIRFDEDGTCRQAHALDELDSKPYAIMYYEFEDNKMILSEKAVFGVPSCGKKISSYRVELLSNGNMKIIVGTDDCTPRMRELQKEWSPVQ